MLLWTPFIRSAASRLALGLLLLALQPSCARQEQRVFPLASLGVTDPTADRDPAPPEAELASDPVTGSVFVALTLRDCSGGRDWILVTEGPKPQASDPGWQICSLETGAIAYRLDRWRGDGLRTLHVWARSPYERVSTGAAEVNLVYDGTPPRLSGLQLASGESVTAGPVVLASASAEDLLPPIEVALQERPNPSDTCPSHAPASVAWNPLGGAGTSQPFLLSGGDGLKGVCAWARDSLGNESSNAGIIGVDLAVIRLETGTPPRFTYFEVTRATGSPISGGTIQAGEPLLIRYAAEDAEALAANPIDLYLSTNGARWTSILQGVGQLGSDPRRVSGTYAGFTAPGNAPFWIKAIARDAQGNSSLPAHTNLLGVPNWSVYAGNRDRGLGSSPRTVALGTIQQISRVSQIFAVHPKNHDVYAIDAGRGIYRLDARKGQVSAFIEHGKNNLVPNGPLPANPMVDTIFTNLAFDSSGLLYLNTPSVMGERGEEGSRLFQIDLEARTSRLVMGAGRGNDENATPASAHIMGGSFGFDENDSLYYLSSCTPGSWDSSSSTSQSAFRILRSQRQTDGSFGAISRVAGSCLRGQPVAGANALESPLGTDLAPSMLFSFAVWNQGKTLYFSYYDESAPTLVWKIISGTVHPTRLERGGLAFNPHNRRLYVGRDAIDEVVPNLLGPNGETSSLFVASTGKGSCAADGVDYAAACANTAAGATSASFAFGAQGTVFFGDGEYRVRYRDSNGRIQTLLGGLPLQAEGLNRLVIRGTIAGIHYKPASAPNQAAFPEGLYFLDSAGPAMGHIHPQTGTARILWGGQQGQSEVHSDGTAVTPELGLGIRYLGGNAMPLTFDDLGLPWLRYEMRLVSVSAEGRVMARQAPSAALPWEDAATGSDPAGASLDVFGGWQNLARKAQGIFLIGGYFNTATARNVRKPVLKFFDFGNHSVTNVIGGSTAATSPDSLQPGSVQSLTLSPSCVNQGRCFLQYSPEEDRLYFSEDYRLRFITHPAQPGASTLETLFSVEAGNVIENFILSPDRKQIFYVSGEELHCHDLGSTKAWCDDQALGPGVLLPGIQPGPDQLTWKDPGHLLISSYSGFVYEFSLPP